MKEVHFTRTPEGNYETSFDMKSILPGTVIGAKRIKGVELTVGLVSEETYQNKRERDMQYRQTKAQEKIADVVSLKDVQILTGDAITFPSGARVASREDFDKLVKRVEALEPYKKGELDYTIKADSKSVNPSIIHLQGISEEYLEHLSSAFPDTTFYN